MPRFVRFVDGRRVKDAIPKPDGTFVIILDNGHGVRGQIRVFRSAAEYQKHLIIRPSDTSEQGRSPGEIKE